MNKSTVVKQRETYTSVENYEENCYLFSQSIQRQRIIHGKPYYVRSYFTSGKNFNETVERLATKHANKIAG